MKSDRLKKILKSKAYKSLMEFMEGQTVDEDGIYEGDFMRWFNKLEVID